MVRATGLEPVRPKSSVSKTDAATNYANPAFNGGQGWIWTTVDRSQGIYSPPQLTALPPTQNNGGEPGTRTLKPFLTTCFQDKPTTNYHNSPFMVGEEGLEPSRGLASQHFKCCASTISPLPHNGGSRR